MEEDIYPDNLQKSFKAPLHVANKRGRPSKQKEIRFSSQPKSIVSQLLCNLKANHRNITVDVDLEQEIQDVRDVQDAGEVEPKIYNCAFCTFR